MDSTPAFHIPRLSGPEEMVRNLDQLPSTPAILPRLLVLLKSDSASLDEVIDLIRVDPAITARTLQLGSSAYYNPQGHVCESVDEAVHRVGLNQVYKLVSYAATAQLLLRPLAAYQRSPEDTWRRSVSCALAADQLARNTDIDRSIAYTVGLLHGIGMVAIDHWRQRQRLALTFSSAGIPDETIESEKRLLGFDNAAVGAALLKQWDFPANIVDPVACQYDPRACPKDLFLACLLHVAKWLRDAAHIPEALPLPPYPDEWILQTVEVAPESLETRLYQVREAYAEAGKLLQA